MTTYRTFRPILYSVLGLVLLYGSQPVQAADMTRQPVQRMPAPAPVQKSPATQPLRSPVTQPATRQAVPWQPLMPYSTRFEQERSRLRAVVQDMGVAPGETASTAESLQDVRDEMAEVRALLAELRTKLRRVMAEIDALSSLMRQAAMADRSRSLSRGQGDQMVRDLQRKLAVLEKEQAGLESLIGSLEEQYQTMSDMSQQLQLQLQDAMNRQQQAMQILSSIMKNLHDTLKAIIQNMK